MPNEVANAFQNAMPQSVGSAPSAVPGYDVGSMLKSIDEQNAQILSLSKAAYTPIQGPHQGTLPTSMTRPIPQAMDTPLDTRQMVGASNARGQAIANLITTVGNTVGKVVQKEKQKKQDDLKDAATTVFTAQMERDQAIQAEAVAKASGDTAAEQTAHASVLAHERIIEGIDPKKMKDLAKGLNYSYTDAEANKTEFHQAVQDAHKNIKDKEAQRQAILKAKADYTAKMGQSFSKALDEHTPASLVPNTAAQQQLASAKAQQTEMIKIYAPMIAQQGRYTQAQALQKAAQIHSTQLAFAKTVAQFVLADKNKAATASEDDKKIAATRALQAQGQINRLNVMHEAMRLAVGNPIKQTELYEKEAKAYEDDVKASNTLITDAQKQITNLVSSAASAQGDGLKAIQSRIEELNKQIDDEKTRQKTIGPKHDAVMKNIKDAIGGYLDTGSSTTGAANTTGVANSGTATAADAVEELEQQTESEDDTSWLGVF